MKQSEKTMLGVVVAVLLAAMGIGLAIRYVRLNHGQEAAEPNVGSVRRGTVAGRQQLQPGKTADAEDRARVKQEREQAIEKSASMSEQDKEKLKAQMREDLVRRSGGAGMSGSVSDKAGGERQGGFVNQAGK